MRRDENTALIIITPSFLLCMALAILLIPLKWLFAWMLAAAIHELSHYAALQLCNCSVLSIRLSVGGAEITTEPIPNGKECLCALAGPAGGLLLLLLAPKLPILSVCAFLQSIYNLLPIFPMDGGRVLSCIIRMLFSETSSEMILKKLKVVILICLILLGLFATVKLNLGLLPLIAAVMLAVRNKNSLAMRPRKEYNMNNIS